MSNDYTVPDDNDFNCSVHADFSFIIPPQSEVVVPARLNSIPKKSNVFGLTTPRSTLPIFGASELICVSEDGTVPMRMINPSSQPVKSNSPGK